MNVLYLDCFPERGTSDGNVRPCAAIMSVKLSKVSVDLFFRPHIDASLRRLTLTERDHMNEAKPLPSLFLDNDGEPVSTLCDSDIDESHPGSHPEFFLYLTSVRSHRTS